MVLSQALRSRLLSVVRPWLQEDPFLDLDLGFLTSSGTAMDLLLDPSPLNLLIESSTRLLFKSIRIREVSFRISPWSSPSVSVKVHGMDVVLSPRELMEGGRPVSIEELEEMEMKKVLEAMDPEGLVLHEMIIDAVSAGSSTSLVAMALRDSLLRSLQVRFQDVCFKLELIDDSCYCLMKVSELALGPQVNGRSGLIGGFVGALFSSGNESLLDIRCSGLEVRVRRGGPDKRTVFVKDSCLGVNVSGSKSMGFYALIPRAEAFLTPLEIPILVVTSYMFSPEGQKLSRSGRELWKLAARNFRRLNSQSQISLLKAFRLAVVWVRYVRTYESLLLFVRYHNEGPHASSVNSLPSLQKCFDRAACELSVIRKLEKDLSPVAVARARIVARNRILPRSHSCKMLCTEHLTIISLLSLVLLPGLFRKFLFYIYYMISHMLLLLWKLLYFFGGEVMHSSPTLCFNLASRTSPGCLTVNLGEINIKLAHSDVNQMEKTSSMSSNLSFISLLVSVKSFFFTHRKAGQTNLILGKLQVCSCSGSTASSTISVDAEPPFEVPFIGGLGSQAILWSEQAVHYSRKTSDSAKASNEFCQQILENSSMQLLSDWDMIFPELQTNHSKDIVHPFVLFRLENIFNENASFTNSLLQRCDLMTGMICLSLGFFPIDLIYSLVADFWHSFNIIEHRNVTSNSASTVEKTLAGPKELLEVCTTEMNAVMFDMIPKRNLHIAALIGGFNLDMLMDQNGVQNDSGPNGEKHCFSINLRTFEIAICPALKEIMRTLGIDLGANEFPEYLLVEPRITPILQQTKPCNFSSRSSIRHNIFLNFEDLGAAWKNSKNGQVDQAYPILGPIIVTMSSSTSRDTLFSFCSSNNASSMAINGKIEVAAFLFIDELSIFFQSLENMHFASSYPFAKENSLVVHEELDMKLLLPISKNLLVNNLTAEQKDGNLFDRRSWATDVSFELGSLDIFLGHSRKIFTGKTDDTSSYGSYFQDVVGDLSDLGIWIRFLRSDIKLFCDELLLKVLVNLSGLESILLKNQNRGPWMNLLMNKSSDPLFDDLYTFSFSSSKFDFLTGYKGKEPTSNYVGSCSTSAIVVDSNVDISANTPGNGSRPHSFSDTNLLHGSLNSGFWASLDVVLGDATVMANSIKNLVTTMPNPREFQMSLCLSGEPPAINCEAQGGNIILETSALVAFCQYFKLFSVCIANSLPWISCFWNQSNEETEHYYRSDISCQFGTNDLVASGDSGISSKWNIYPSLGMKLSHLSLTLSASNETGGIGELQIELDLILQLVDSWKKFSFDLVRLSVFSHEMHVGLHNHVCTSHKPYPDLSPHRHIHPPMGRTATAEGITSVSGAVSASSPSMNFVKPLSAYHEPACNHDNCILAHLTVSMTVELACEESCRNLGKNWIGNGFVSGFDITTTFDDIQIILSLVAPFSAIPSAKMDNDRNSSSDSREMGPRSLDFCIPDGAIVAIQDIHQHMYLAVENVGRKYRVVGTLHYTLLGVKSLFKVRYHSQKRWWSHVSLFSLTSLHAKNDIGEPLRLNSSPGSSFVEVSSSDDKRWSLWEAMYIKSDNYENNDEPYLFHTSSRNAFHMVNSKNDCGIAFNDGLPEFVKKPGDLFKVKVLHEYDLLPDVRDSMIPHLYTDRFDQNASSVADLAGKTGSLKSLSITTDEITWTIFHKAPNAKDKFPIVRGLISKFSIVCQSFPTKFRILSVLTATTNIFDAQRNMWRELISPTDISIFIRSRHSQKTENIMHGIPTRIFIGMKQIDISLSEVSLDVLLFFAEKLNIVGPYAVKRSAIFSNICKVENHSGLNLICHFSTDEEAIVSRRNSASLSLRGAATGYQLQGEELSVLLSFSEMGRLTTPIQIQLSREQFFAWRTRVTSLSDSRTFPGPFIVVEVSNNNEDGLSLVVSTLLRIHNDSGFPLNLRFQRPDETTAEFASFVLRNGDTMDDARASFDASDLSGGLKRALTSLTLGNFLLSVKPDVTDILETSKRFALVQWSDNLKGEKAARISGIFDKLNYRFRKALRIESMKSFFNIIQCPVVDEGVHAFDLYFLVRTIARTVPVVSPQNVGDSSEPLAFQICKEICIFPTITVHNLLQSEIVVLLTENYPDTCRTDNGNNFGREARITSGASAALYVNPAKIYFTVTVSALSLTCKPVNSGDCAKKLNKENRVNHFDIDLEFDGGRFSVLLRLCRGEHGILEATMFTPYTLHNCTEISILCLLDDQRFKSWKEEKKNIQHLSPEFGVVLPPASSLSWFLKSKKLHLRWLKEEASYTFLDLDAISGVTEVSLVSQTPTGITRIAKLGVSLAPCVLKQPVPSQLVNIVPRYVILNESRSPIFVRQCYLENDSDFMTIESKQKAAFYMQDHSCKARETGFIDSIFRKHRIGNEDCLVFIQFKVKDAQTSWSGPICVASLGRFCIKFKKIEEPTSIGSSSSMVSDFGSTQFAGVHVMEEGPSLVIHFNMPPNFALPYKIENRLQNLAIFCSQKESTVPEILGPGTSAGYVWDDQRLPHKLVVQIGGFNMLREINIDKVRPWKPFFKIRKSRGLAGPLAQDIKTDFQVTDDFDIDNVGFEVYTDGLTRIVRICKFSESSIEEKAFAPRMSVQFRLSGLAVSFLESTAKDFNSVVTTEYSVLIIIRFISITSDMVFSGQQKCSYVKVQSITADEKWHGAPFASMIRRSEQSDCSMNENMLYIVIINNMGGIKVKQVKYTSIVLQPIDINIDEDTLMRLLKFWRSSLSSSGTSSTLFYFEHFEIHPIKIIASFLPGNQLSNYSSVQEALRSLLHNVIKVPTIKNASVELNGVLLTHALVTTKELLMKCAQHYSWYVLRAIYKAKGSHLLPPAFASIFDDSASSSLDVFFDPSDGSINLPGLTLGMFKFISRNINSRGFSGSKRYLGDLGKTVKRFGSNAIFAAVTEISDSVLRGAEANGFNGLVTGFHQGLLHLAMEPARLGVAVMEGGPDRVIKLDRTPGIEEQYIEGYLQAMLDTAYKQEYLRVKVHDNQVFLKNLPPSTTLITEIVEQVKNFLMSKGLLIGETSMSSHSFRHLRCETDWKIGPTLLTLCEHLFVSFAIRALRSQTSKLVGGIKFFKGNSQEKDEAPTEATKGSLEKPGRFWVVGRFALSGLLAYVDGRLCRHIPHPIARRIVSGFLLSFLEKKEGE